MKTLGMDIVPTTSPSVNRFKKVRKTLSKNREKTKSLLLKGDRKVVIDKTALLKGLKKNKFLLFNKNGSFSLYPHYYRWNTFVIIAQSGSNYSYESTRNIWKKGINHNKTSILINRK